MSQTARRRVASAGLLVLIPVAALAAGRPKPRLAPPALTLEHQHPSGAFSFRTPASWAATPVTPETLDVAGQGLLVRFVYRPVESGYDSLHVTCMLERLAPAMEMAPTVRYEYDFIGGAVGERRALDSAFVVTYDKPVLGHREWRQRTVTVVGAGQSLCVITYAPQPLWKKSPDTRALLNGILGSVLFR